MPSNRPPRGGKPTSGRPKSSPSTGGARKGGRTDKPAERGPSAGAPARTGRFGKSGDTGFGRAAGPSAGTRSENDRPDRGDRPPTPRPTRPSYSPRKDSADRPARPARAASDRPARSEGARSDRPTRSEGAFSGRSTRGETSYTDRSERPSRAGSTRPPRPTRSEGTRSDRPARGEGPRTDRPARGEGGYSERPDRMGRPTGTRPTSTRSAAPSGRSGPDRTERFDRTERPTRTPREERAPRVEEREGFIEVDEADDINYAEGVGDIVFGRHPVMAVLEGEQSINKVWILKTLQNPQIVAKVRELARAKGATVQMVERAKLDSLTLDANHQGLVASVSAAKYAELEEVIEKAKASAYPALLMLDGIEDPHNLGALIRTAEGAGFAGVIIPSRRAVGLTPVVHKSSAGALSRMPVARVGNLAQAVQTLHDAGFWLAGADARATSLPYEIDMTVPIVVVVGAEGKGLSKLLGDKCDWLVKLQLGGELESLNASVAGGVLMYEAVRQRWSKEQAAAESGPEIAGG